VEVRTYGFYLTLIRVRGQKTMAEKETKETELIYNPDRKKAYWVVIGKGNTYNNSFT
jgi:hypothetical protein